ncbi:Lrp/AsnC family transcriptional regulator [Pseudoruegeria sp. HB172150]|uniref:Lrp/AsnC family transcriptional regulator n=1 Tax=Pseudoruegeria sp. HB172150 TaxID=2721164 RepID=UPI0015544CA2|nr:Lrp/AsnC family transcriptional regulator [Pseudoruegeria sp. HB172150]
MLDDMDRRLLRLLQDDPGRVAQDLAEHANLSVPQVQRRLEKLRGSGVIRGTRAVIDWRALGYEVQVSLRFNLDKTQRSAFDEFLAAAREVPEVIEIQTFLGKVDVRLNVIARDMRHYQDIYRNRILRLPHIADIEALVLVATVKAEEWLPI